MSVTREQMAAFIYRMVNKGQSVEGGENTTLFTDLDDPTFYAMISWANENGIIKGKSTTEFDPKGSITLQDCYTMVVRALEYEKESSLSYPDGYINIAKEIGLSQNIDASIADTAFLTRGDVANWGVVVNDIINGTAVVENSALDYNENTFIVTKSATDGYHPNMLSGYITTQMVYSVLTGEKAFGEDYSFCTDTTVNEKFSVEAFLKSYYKYDNVSPEDSETKLTGDELTTFPEVFKSQSDMEGIQKLIDKYLEAK